MSIETLGFYDSHFDEQTGENGVFTEPAVFDPSGVLEQTIYGIFDDGASQESKDGGNVRRKQNQPRFLMSTLPSFDLDTNKQLSITRLNKIYTIQSKSVDERGVQVLWLA